MGRKIINRVYVPGQKSEFIGYGISYHGKGVGDDIKNAFKKFGKIVHKGVTSKPFKDTVRFLRKNIATPLAKVGVNIGAKELPKLLGMIPGIGVPLSTGYQLLGGEKLVTKVGNQGINYVNEQAEKNGYGIRQHGSGIRPHGTGIAPHGGSLNVVRAVKNQTAKRNKAINTLVDSMLKM
jgi:hypothetical protein